MDITIGWSGTNWTELEQTEMYNFEMSNIPITHTLAEEDKDFQNDGYLALLLDFFLLV